MDIKERINELLTQAASNRTFNPYAIVSILYIEFPDIPHKEIRATFMTEFSNLNNELVKQHTRQFSKNLTT